MSATKVALQAKVLLKVIKLKHIQNKTELILQS